MTRYRTTQSLPETPGRALLDRWAVVDTVTGQTVAIEEDWPTASAVAGRLNAGPPASTDAVSPDERVRGTSQAADTTAGPGGVARAGSLMPDTPRVTT